jgi:hypothetical protein
MWLRPRGSGRKTGSWAAVATTSSRSSAAGCRWIPQRLVVCFAKYMDGGAVLLSLRFPSRRSARNMPCCPERVWKHSLRARGFPEALAAAQSASCPQCFLSCRALWAAWANGVSSPSRFPCCHVLRCLCPWQAFTGTRTLAGGPPAAPTVSSSTATAPAKTKSSGPLVPPQLRGRKNVCTEDVHDAASKKKKTK